MGPIFWSKWLLTLVFQDTTRLGVGNPVIATFLVSRATVCYLRDPRSFTRVPQHLGSVDPHVLRETPSIA